MYQNVLIETKWYLVLIRFSILVSNLTFLDFAILGYFFLKTFISKTASLRYVFDKVPSAKWLHKPGEKIMFFVNICHLHCILPSKLRFSSSDHFFVFSVQLIHFTGGMFPVYTVYIQYILYNRSNISNRSNWFKKLRKLTLNDVNRHGKICKLTLNDVNRYGKLRKLTVNYASRYGKLRKQAVRKRQNSRRGFR